MRIVVVFFLLYAGALNAQQSKTKLALLKYSGGGDWYANLETSLPNLIEFCNEELDMNLAAEQAIVEAGSADIFQYPFVHMTGHGNVIFSTAELENLRNYLLAGGFLHIDDNYGMDVYIRTQLERLFPDRQLSELPSDFPIFNSVYNFPKGLPKIHEHDDERPQAFGIFENGRLVCLYTYESDLGDGWEDQSIHNDSQVKRLQALRMGANILSYVFSGENPAIK